MTEKYLRTLKQIQALVNEALAETGGGTVKPAKVNKPLSDSKPPSPPTALSFDMNVVAFMNKHAKGMSGPAKFTLLVAYLAKGDPSAQVPYQEISDQWNRMKTVLGKFNAVSGNRAKASGWVEPVKKGVWKLTGSWKDIF